MNETFFIVGLGLIMGVIQSISGGAGVLGVPAMLAFGIPPINALALNRVSDLGVIFGALRGFQKSKNIDWKLALQLAIPLGIGAFVGSKIIVSIPEHLVRYVILVGIVVGIIFILLPAKQAAPSQKKIALGIFLMFLVGIWDGALALAGATFGVLILVHLFGRNFLNAKGTHTAAVIPETLIAIVVLYLSSTISWQPVIAMFASNFIGAWIGSHLAVRYGDRLIKKAMVAIAVVMIVKVILDFNG